jgi:hypothetical protein
MERMVSRGVGELNEEKIFFGAENINKLNKLFFGIIMFNE